MIQKRHVLLIVTLIVALNLFFIIQNPKVYGADWTTPSSIHSKCGQQGDKPATNAIDDNTGTFWQHYDTCFHWIIFDMGTTKTITKIRIFQYTEAIYRWGKDVGLYVYVSNDVGAFGAAVWEGVLNAEGWQESGEFSKNGRYVKLVSKSNADTQVMYEFDAYAEPLSWHYVEAWNFNLKTPTSTITVTLATNPSGLDVRLDSGVWYAAPHSYIVVKEQTYLIECVNIKEPEFGKRYVWISWSDAGANPHPIYPLETTTYTATYETQCFFTVNSAHDAPTGEGWYKFGSGPLYSTVTTPSEGYQTTGWTGTGSLSSGGTVGSDKTTDFWITEYTTCTWNWEAILEPTWHTVETWNFNLKTPHVPSWNHVETWQFNLNTTAEWRMVETWNFNLGSKGWNHVETWSFTLNSTAQWRTVETWNFNLHNHSWHTVETWNFTLNATASWQQIETWNFNLYNSAWHTIESWNFSLAPCIYTFHGPFNEETGLKDGNITVWIYPAEATPYSFTLDGTYGITEEQPPICFRVNIADYNYTRYYVPITPYEDIYVFKPNDPYYYYSVDLLDLVGVQNAYLESYIALNGSTFTVERHHFIAGNKIPYLLTWGKTYGFRIICTQGVYDFGYVIPTTEETLVFTLTNLNFPSDYTSYEDISLSATRVTDTLINILYEDTAERTNNVDVTVYRVGPQNVWIQEHEAQSSNILDITWNQAEANQDYIVEFIVDHADYGVLTWTFPCPSLAGGGNPWDLSFLGDWPIDSTQIIGVALTLFVFSCFTTKNAHIGVLAEIITAAFFTYIGWLAMSWTLITILFSLAVLYALSRRRRSRP